MSYFYLAMTILLTVYGQIVLKTEVVAAGSIPADWPEKARFFGRLLLQPWVLSAFAAAFLASIFWMAAVSKLELSHAYPFTSLSFVFVLLFSSLFLGEAMTPAKIAGLALIVAGLVIASRG